MAIYNKQHLAPLKEAFQKGNLTLYLGAGVSKPSGLPNWEELAQILYFDTLGDESYIYNLKPYPNYLFALAEWILEMKKEPIDITIRKIKQWYDDDDFIERLGNTLYAGLGRENKDIEIDRLPQEIIEKNSTLDAILKCCEKSVPGKKGLKSIVTYNYDNLLELGLENFPTKKENFRTIFKGDQKLKEGNIPIYHVHGYIPYQNNDVKYEDIIFSAPECTANSDLPCTFHN